MTDLSFLPREELRRRPRQVPRPARLVALAGAAAVAGTALWYQALVVVDYVTARRELAALESEYQRLQGALELQRRVQEAERRLAEYEQLVRPYVVDVSIREALEALNASVPPEVVLDRVAVDAQRQVVIAGWAASLTDVARLMVALETSGRFTGLRAAFPGRFAAGPEPSRSLAQLLLQVQDRVRFELRGALAGTR